MDTTDDSSIDGELIGFLSKHGIGDKNNNSKPSGNSNDGGDDDVDAAANATDISDILPADQSEHFDARDVLMPAAAKLNRLLTTAGFRVDAIAAGQVDMESRSVSLFAVDGWADSISVAVAELLERQQNSHQALRNASNSGALPSEVLMGRVEDLQAKLLECERKEKLTAQQNRILGKQGQGRRPKYAPFSCSNSLNDCAAVLFRGARAGARQKVQGTQDRLGPAAEAPRTEEPGNGACVPSMDHC